MKDNKFIPELISILLIISSFSCVVEIPLHGDITGYVTDAETSEPIPQAKLKLIQPNDSTFTGDNGSYFLRNIEPGNYQIQASKQKYSKAQQTVSVNEAETAELDFALNLLPYPEVSVSFLDFGDEDMSRSFTIKNVGAGTLVYSCQTTLDWINFSPSSGEATDEVDTITVTIDRAALSDETYKEKFRILSLGGEEDKWDTVNVYLNGLADVDGNYYKMVTIGTQTWIAENLNTGTMKFFTGEPVLSDNGEIEKYCYENNEDNCDTYGGLYSWNEMMDYVSVDEGTERYDGGTLAGYSFHSQQGICPAGWHIPAAEEWDILISFVDKATGGAKLKADSPLWVGDTINKTDEFGFSVLPGGGLFSHPETQHTTLGFHIKGEHAQIWKASTDIPFYWAEFLWIGENMPAIDKGGLTRQNAISVRCIKDPE